MRLLLYMDRRGGEVGEPLKAAAVTRVGYALASFSLVPGTTLAKEECAWPTSLSIVKARLAQLQALSFLSPSCNKPSILNNTSAPVLVVIAQFDLSPLFHLQVGCAAKSRLGNVSVIQGPNIRNPPLISSCRQTSFAPPISRRETLLLRTLQDERPGDKPSPAVIPVLLRPRCECR